MGAKRVVDETETRKSVCLTGDTAYSIGKILFDLYARVTEVRLAHLNADISSRSSHSAAAVLNVNVSGYSGSGFAGTYLKALYDDWLNGGRLDLILDNINADKIEVSDVIIYPAAEDRATTELDGDGTSPNYLTESSQSNLNEAAGMATPAWTEDIDFEQAGTLTVISIYAELYWAQKQTGGGTSSAKMQISGDGGSTWVDLTDNVTETGTSYALKTRAGVGRWLTAITAGANQLQIRLCQWGGTTSSQVKLREDSYLRITYRKS